MANPFIQQALAAGLTPELANAMPRIVQIESGGNPNAVTGKYQGLLQMGPAEAAKYGGTGYNSGVRLIADRAKWFNNKYGRQPTPLEMYMTHQQGMGGVAAHMAHPDQPAWMNMYSTGEGRKKGIEWSKRAIWGNVPSDVRKYFPGGVDKLTSEQFFNIWRNKINRVPVGPAYANAAMMSAKAQAPAKVTDPNAVAGGQTYQSVAPTLDYAGGVTGPAPRPRPQIDPAHTAPVTTASIPQGQPMDPQNQNPFAGLFGGGGGQGGALSGVFGKPNSEWNLGAGLQGLGAGLVVAGGGPANAFSSSLAAQNKASKSGRKWKIIGSDEYGKNTYGWVDESTGQRWRADGTEIGPGQSVSAGSSPAALSGATSTGTVKSKLFGEDKEFEAQDVPLYASMDPKRRLEVEGMVSGRIKPPAGRNLNTPYWNKNIQAAIELSRANGGDWDMATWTARNKTALEYGAGGRIGQQYTALDQAAHHIDQLNDSVNELIKLDQSNVHSFNKLKNLWARETGFDPERQKALKGFEHRRAFVAHELARVAKGTGVLNSQEIQQFHESLQEADTPIEMRKALSAVMQLMNARREAMNDNYKLVMGNRVPYKNSFFVKTMDKFDKELLDMSAGKASTAEPASSAAPASGATRTIGNKTYRQDANGDWYEE